MKVKYGLRFKLTIIFILCLMLLTAAIIVYNAINYNKIITQDYSEQATNSVNCISKLIKGDDIDEYVKVIDKNKNWETDLEYSDMLDKKSKEDNYKKYKKLLKDFKETLDLCYVYIFIYDEDADKGTYIFDAELSEKEEKFIHAECSKLGEAIRDDEYIANIKGFLALNKEVSDKIYYSSSEQGDVIQNLASAYAIIRDSSGKVIGYLGVDVNVSSIDDMISDYSKKMIYMMLTISVISLIVILIIIHKFIIIPIKKINGLVDNITSGKYGDQIEVRGRDEIACIGAGINRMSLSIADYIKEMRIINQIYCKYVPAKIFELMDKSNIIDLKLGNHKELNLLVINFNVVNFENLIKKMSSDQMFNFINKVLLEALPFITKKGGEIEDFSSSGFTAFYTDGTDSGLGAVVSLCQNINVINASQGFETEEEVKVGIGMTYGLVMFGVVGHEKRCEAISISMQTRLCEYLQNITGKYSSKILISEAMFKNVKDFSKKYHSRCIGYLYNSIDNRAEKIYDVFDGDCKEEFYKKMGTKEIFEQGVEQFYNKDFAAARISFIKVLRDFRNDNASKLYLNYCNKYCELADGNSVDVYIERY